METFKYLIFAVAILIVLAYIYTYIKEQNIVQFYYYVIQNKLYDVYKSKIGYYDILFNIQKWRESEFVLGGVKL